MKSRVRNCEIGKSCGASCINRGKACLIGLAPQLNQAVGKTAGIVKSKTSSTTAPGLKQARVDSKDVDDRIVSNGVSAEYGVRNYDWDKSLGRGSKELGKGVHGVVMSEEGTDNVVKRGKLGNDEITILKKVGDRDLAPKLVSAQLDGKVDEDTKLGRVSMVRLQGDTLHDKMRPDEETNGVKAADSLWKARAELHRIGVAHNDMHPENVFIDDKGKARFIDFGLSQDSYKAALAEALGAFSKNSIKTIGLPPEDATFDNTGAAKNGDWQISRWRMTGALTLYTASISGRGTPEEAKLEKSFPALARVWKNSEKVFDKMRQDGLSNKDIFAIVNHGIRSPLSSYNTGVWPKLTDSQIKGYIEMLYEGV